MIPIILACTIQPSDFCFSPGHCDDKIVQLIDEATTTIDVAIYSLNREVIVDALMEATLRHVKVRVLLDRLQSSNASEKKQLNRLARATIEMHAAHHKGIMHQKIAIIDGRWLVWGSFNWTDPATTDNDEIVSYADCPDAAAIAQAEFDKRWAKAKAAESP